jgi:mRNA interferase MazF
MAIQHWQEAGLFKRSLIKPVIATIERGLVRRKLGHLRPTDIDVLRTVLGTIIGP